jgi:hypothetical protein
MERCIIVWPIALSIHFRNAADQGLDINISVVVMENCNEFFK